MEMTQNYKRFLSIDLTKRCTNDCRFCVVSGTRGITKDQKFEDIENFLTEYSKDGFKRVNLHGGEPQLFYRFDDLIKLINDLGYEEIVIQTNGYRLNDQNFVTNLLERNVKLFTVSFHDCDEKSHNFLTGNPKSYHQVITGIKNVLELGGNVSTNTVLVNSNYRRVKNIVDTIYDINVKRINISSLNPWWIWIKSKKEQYSELCPTYVEMAPLVKETLDAYKDKDLTLTLEGFPFCFLPGYEEHNLFSYDRDITLLSENNFLMNYEEYATTDLRDKRDECRACRFDSQCGGVWKGYIAYKGWDEFQPIEN